jgi:hypothetical protein
MKKRRRDKKNHKRYSSGSGYYYAENQKLCFTKKIDDFDFARSRPAGVQFFIKCINVLLWHNLPGKHRVVQKKENYKSWMNFSILKTVILNEVSPNIFYFCTMYIHYKVHMLAPSISDQNYVMVCKQICQTMLLANKRIREVFFSMTVNNALNQTIYVLLPKNLFCQLRKLNLFYLTLFKKLK